jgi:hypothetical protein
MDIETAQAAVDNYRNADWSSTNVICYDAEDIMNYLQNAFSYIRENQRVPEDYKLAVGFYPSLKEKKLNFIVAPVFVAQSPSTNPQVLDCFTAEEMNEFNRTLQREGSPAFAFNDGTLWP